MEEDFTALLSGAVAEPVHWRMQPMLQKDLPFVNLSLVSAPTDYVTSGATGAQGASIQVDCWGRTYSDAVTLARSVKAALSGFSGISGTTIFHVVFHEVERDLGGNLPQDDGGSRIFGRSADYRVVYS